ncbi:type VI secretion system Vgr family protein [Paenochrobactrum glaciei]|uniref:Type VI secretion system tip protein VgrG n=1 Tax=Paenochrobactrum glaciei TaxID=486407 RepID=A0ABP3RNK9_9HYPH
MFDSDQSNYDTKIRCLALKLNTKNNFNLHVETAKISDGIGKLFSAEIVFDCEAVDSPRELIGSPAEVEFNFVSGLNKLRSRRVFSGLITEFQILSTKIRGRLQCSVIIQPVLWRLSQSTDYRIWQNMNAVEIVETLLKEYNIPAADFRLHGEVFPEEYSVQFGETDLDYMVRRLENAGLFWWFHHDGNMHKFCVGDQPSSWIKAQDWAGDEAVFYLNENQSGPDLIKQWRETYRSVSCVCASADWNFEMPEAAITAQIPALIRTFDPVEKETYLFPTGARTVEDAERLQKLRISADESRHCIIAGHSTAHEFAPAQIFTPAFQQGGQLPGHVVIEIVHHIKSASPLSGEEEPIYYNEFKAISAEIAYLPMLNATKPHIETTQIAIVAGPQNEQIHCDQYGRIKLWFPWDKRAKKDGSDTCWVRLAQVCTGRGWGSQIIPRIGSEVLVSFLNGNPDQPVVTGMIANPIRMPAYTLPDAKSRLTIRTQSYKGDGFNEISLEDGAGRENIFTQAQKDQTQVVRGSSCQRVNRHKINHIGGNETKNIGGNCKMETAGSVLIAVGSSGSRVREEYNKKATLNQKTIKLLDEGCALGQGAAHHGFRAMASVLRAHKMGFWAVETISKYDEFLANDSAMDAGLKLAELGDEIGTDYDNAFQGNGEQHIVVSRLRSTSIGEACVEQVGGGKLVHVGDVFHTHTGRQHLVSVGQDLSLLSGQTTLVEAKKIDIFADDHVRLSTPGGYIELHQKGITIHGLKIDIQGNHVDFQKGGGGKGTTKTVP